MPFPRLLQRISVVVLSFGLIPMVSATSPDVAAGKNIQVQRLLDAPIIYPALSKSLGHNIQGPSLIRVPEWVRDPLGKYYLYFADHKGAYIRLAYADQLTGPWQIYEPGTLHIKQTDFPQRELSVSAMQRLQVKLKMQLMGINSDDFPHDIVKDLTVPHIASPDVHVDNDNQRILMYFHGLKAFAQQVTRVAISQDGLSFSPQTEDLGNTYLRAFEYEGYTYALTMPGQFYRSRDGFSQFEKGPLLFNKDMRHAGLLKRGKTLYVFWTQVGHAPERILLSKIDISKPWQQWTATQPQELLRPERSWEGADKPLEPSLRSVAYGEVNQLRDPYIFEDEGKLYLLYVVAGERGIAIAKLEGID
ncbi:hypothetical protein R50073_19570 [Maricurvus nonylphenolicus]|uniref:hypothetical protein n=1 Tax=Maricurvus nonylphenolicus TaxID=1008307 RepID=UPI0036F275D8